jgi:hypothetical protein
MNFFSKFYLDLILIIMIGLLMNPLNGMLKLSLLFLFIFWAIIHILIIKRLFSKNEMLAEMIREDQLEKDDPDLNNFRTKLIKNLKRIYYISCVLGILGISLLKGGFFIIAGILITAVEILKFMKVRKIMKDIENEKETSSVNQEV